MALLVAAMTVPGATAATAATMPTVSTPGGRADCPDDTTCGPVAPGADTTAGHRPRPRLDGTPFDRDTSTREPAPVAEAGAESVPDGRSAAANRFGWGEPDADRGHEFDGALDGWGLYDSAGHAGNGTRSPEAITVQDGALRIDGTSDGTSGGLMGRAVQPRFGRWEVRMRVDKRGEGGAYHPVVALVPHGRPYDNGSGDLDFAETDAGSGEVYCFIHYDGRQDYHATSVDLEEWHSYAIEVAPTHITWFVDGRPLMTDTNEDAITGTPWTLNLQLDAYQPSGQAPSTMEVDFFRYYPLPDDGVPILEAPEPRTGSYGG